VFFILSVMCIRVQVDKAVNKDVNKLGLAQYQAVVSAESLVRDVDHQITISCIGEKMLSLADTHWKGSLEKLDKKMLKESKAVIAGQHDGYAMTDAAGTPINAAQLYDRGMEVIQKMINQRKTVDLLSKSAVCLASIVKSAEKPKDVGEADWEEIRLKTGTMKLMELIGTLEELASAGTFKIPFCVEIKSTRVYIDLAWDGKRYVKCAKLMSTEALTAGEDFEEFDVKVSFAARKDRLKAENSTKENIIEEQQTEMILSKLNVCFRSDDDCNRIHAITGALTRQDLSLTYLHIQWPTLYGASS